MGGSRTVEGGDTASRNRASRTERRKGDVGLGKGAEAAQQNYEPKHGSELVEVFHRLISKRNNEVEPVNKWG